jgi:hypothetical protein
MYGSGTLAFYDSETNEVKVLGTDLDVAHRVTLVHELTHAWQDQHGYLDKLDELDDPQAYTLQAVAEGDATRIENEYIDTLSSRERDAYDRQSQQQGADADLSGVPDALIASFSSLYALGGPFAGLLDEEGGNTKVNAALADPPPSEADIVDPNRYLDGVQPVDVAEPSVPAGAERIDGGTFGAVSWLITLSEHIDPRDALDVVDTWAGDQSVTYRQDGRVCTAAAFKGLTSSDTAAAASRIGEWAAAMGGHDASVSQTDGTAVLRSCESSGATWSGGPRSPSAIRPCGSRRWSRPSRAGPPSSRPPASATRSPTPSRRTRWNRGRPTTPIRRPPSAPRPPRPV